MCLKIEKQSFIFQNQGDQEEEGRGVLANLQVGAKLQNRVVSGQQKKKKKKRRVENERVKTKSGS